tara:strand:- start:414 stop:875 length:462 start_codon:yes stop_codon:yes gene_type:complete
LLIKEQSIKTGGILTGRTSQKIYCEAIAKTSGKRCRCKGYYTPTNNRFLCRFHRGAKSWDSKTRKYKGLFKNNKVELQRKINILKNLVNFRNKTDEQIKEYILQEEQRANTYRYRTKYYTRHYLRWRSRNRSSKRLKDQLDDFLQVLRNKSKI